jgi:GNAT superfamily N-acetyltransferase
MPSRVLETPLKLTAERAQSIRGVGQGSPWRLAHGKLHAGRSLAARRSTAWRAYSIRAGLRLVVLVKLAFREARAEDADTLVAFLRKFNASQGYPFEETSARRTLLELLTSPSLGKVWLIVADGAPVGYLVLSFGFSLEYGGRDAFVDEFFVESRARGRGIGRAALTFALNEASRLGIHAVHLEVERMNAAAHALYESVGFAGGERELLTYTVARRRTGG